MTMCVSQARLRWVKSFPVGLWIYLDWCAAPHCTSSWVATTTLGASEDRIWGIISKFWKCAVQ